MNSIELFERREELKSITTDIRAELKDIEDQLSDLFLPLARDALRVSGKDFGTAHIVEGNVAMKVNVGKKVTWDQDALRDTFNSMTPENAQHYAKLTYAVEERKYNTAPPAIKATLENARTTEVGRFTVEIEDQ